MPNKTKKVKNTEGGVTQLNFDKKKPNWILTKKHNYMLTEKKKKRNVE